MPRHRLAVALLVPPPVGHEVDGLRRACDDPSLGRLPPHVTLVPPVNVRDEALAEALAVVRSAAASADRLHLRLGPPRTFLPVTATIHLAVTDDPDRPGGTAALEALRRGALRGPLWREPDHEFVPHVTLTADAPRERIAAALDALGAYRSTIDVASVAVLRHERDHDDVRRWRPIADVLLGGVWVVGRGGLELELTASTLVDPVAAGSEGWSPIEQPDGAVGLVVTARHSGHVVGVAQAWTRDGQVVVGDVAVISGSDWPAADVEVHLRRAIDSIAGDARPTADG